MKKEFKERLILIGIRIAGYTLLLVFAVWLVFALTSRVAEEEIVFITPTVNDTCVYNPMKGEWEYISDSVMKQRKEKEKHEKEELMKTYQRKFEQIEKKNMNKN